MKGRIGAVAAGALLGGLAMLGSLALLRGGSGADPSPYVSQQSSPVRGLSAQEVDDLLQGRGAGFARTAELNGYPGPRHVLDLADRLELEPGQRAVAESLFGVMSVAARGLGAEIVERERRMSAVFAERAVTVEALQASAESLGVLYGRLRAVHLAAHVELTERLTAGQLLRYDALRGYDAHSAGTDSAAHVHIP